MQINCMVVHAGADRFCPSAPGFGVLSMHCKARVGMQVEPVVQTANRLQGCGIEGGADSKTAAAPVQRALSIHPKPCPEGVLLQVNQAQFLLQAQALQVRTQTRTNNYIHTRQHTWMLN